MKRSTWNDRTETLDALFGGRLQVVQRKDGYRFSIDALLLAHFVGPHPGDRVIDLGTGCGIIPLILAFRRKVQRIVALEIQPPLAELARRNAALNRFCRRISVWERDLKELGKGREAGTFDWAISNPPYRRLGAGRVNPRAEKALARHEIGATLGDILRAARDLLREKGRLALVYPASRGGELLGILGNFGLEPKRLQFVHSREGGNARLLLLEAAKGGGAQLQVLPPFILLGPSGEYTPAAENLFR
ncbi:MAG: tRNA1(Val) (adenine(37)-N6)-methyltransferase [Deltaproteobacteria bacterium]|nr:tRNA1(Val) (adenine(37)-N6)-methyltransferase [Deltaproteobacteria bacterium]